MGTNGDLAAKVDDHGGGRRWRRKALHSVGWLPLAILALMATSTGVANSEEPDVTTSLSDILLNPEQLSDPSTLLDIGGSAFEAVADRFLPGVLPLTVPGLGDLGPVTMNEATIIIERPKTVTQLGGWKITIEDSVSFDINGVERPLEFSIELEWESPTGDFSPVVEFDISSASSLSIADVLELSGHLAADAEVQDTIAAESSISNLALSFHWDGDGPSPRTWLDVTGTTTFGTEDIAVSYLFSYDAGGGKGDYFITGVRVDNTDPLATTVSLGGLVKGDWGAIATDLELPEFVLAKVSGLESNETLQRNDLRFGGIPFRFFTGCDACGAVLPEDFELDATLTLLAKIDLASFGEVVADAFDYPDNDSVVDLYGKLGLSFSSVEGTAPVSLEQASLRADVPESGGLNNVLLEWLSVGAWTLTLEYDADPAVGGITVGAQTLISADVDDDQTTDFVFDTSATFTRTTDGTISVGIYGESTTTWESPFGLDWFNLTSVGIGGSFTRSTNGQTAFDAALTAEFALCENPCVGDPSVGTVEARLGITDDTQVQFRIAFGADDSKVPIGRLLGPIAAELGTSPELTGEIGDLELDDLVFAVTVDTAGAVTFESFASANLEPFGHVTSYMFVEAGASAPRFFFGARPTVGPTLGTLLSPPGGTAPAPPDALGEIALPTLGLIAAPVGGFNSPSGGLSQDGFEFFQPLYGCADDDTSNDCSFEVDLDPGVNLVANISFPSELSDLAEALWLDADGGIQFQGTLSLPGVFDPGADAAVKLGLRLTLPRLDPGNAVEFIEDGSLTLGVEIDASATPRIALYVEGLLNTRWRRGADPVDASTSCPLTSIPLPLYEDNTGVLPEEDLIYCYDRLTFQLKSELALTPGGVNVSLLGGLSAPNGWQHPFGLPGMEWLVINDLRVKVDIQFPGTPPATVTINAGFLGEIEIDNGDPDTDNTVLQASFGAGVSLQNIPAPPGVAATPSFKGIRAYVSRLGMSDLAALQATMFPPAPGDDALDLSTLTNVEFQNVEFMFAIASDPDLCLEPRVGFAAELWIDPQRSDVPGDEVPSSDGPCRPFGANVDPAECITNQSFGCFASVQTTIGLDGIFASGSVGEFGIGPVLWEGGLIDLRLKLGEAPIVAVSGGVRVEDLGAGRLSMKMELLPVAKVEFFGYLEAFDAFEVQVDGALELRLDPLWPPELKSDMKLHAALRSDFETELRNQLVSELETIAGSLDELDEALELLARDPIGNLAEARDALSAANVNLPDWVDELIDFVEYVDEELLPDDAPLPTYGQLINGDPYELRSPAIPSCNWFDPYDGDKCVSSDGSLYEPDLWCIPPTGFDAATESCVITIQLPDIGGWVDGALPPTWDDALEDIYVDIVDTIRDIDLVPNIAGLGIDEYLYELSAQLEQARFMTVECAEFSWTGGQGAGDIQVLLLLSVLGDQYGFDVALDLTSPQAGVKTVVEEFLEQLLEFGGQSVSCTGEQQPPDWLETIEAESSVIATTLTLGSAGPVDEEVPVAINGTISPAATTPIDIDLDWGDGTTSTLTGITGTAFEATHTYADDDPTGTPSDLYAVRASTESALAPANTTITVRNVNPIVTITNLDAEGKIVADEGAVTTLVFEFDDVSVDSHDAVVEWGDGSKTAVPNAQSPVSLTHTYLDDDPTRTPFDDIADGIRVKVTDDDRGVGTTSADLRLSNVVPVVTFPHATVEDGIASITVQYSDPLGGDPGTGEISSFTVTAEDVAADTLTLRTTFAGDFGSPGWLQFSNPTCVTKAPAHQTCTWSVSAVPDPHSGIHSNIAVGTYDLVLNVTDDDTGTAGVTLRITVEPEDARTWYEGPTFAATTSALSGEAAIEPRATVRDITSAVDPSHDEWDKWPGDIRTATMTFMDRDDGFIFCSTSSIDAVFSPFDAFNSATNIGVGTCDWDAVVSDNAKEYTLTTGIGGNYTRDEPDDDAVVTVARPLDDFITGGGYLVLANSAGEFAGDETSHANFGFHVKFNKRGTNLQGGATIIVRRGGHVYRIKSNSTSSLGVSETNAQFEAKANLSDVTDKYNPVSIGGNFVLQMRMTDLGEGDGQDVLSFALWDVQRVGRGKNATTTQLLLFSSKWDGQQTQLQQIAGGNLMVHSSKYQ